MDTFDHEHVHNICDGEQGDLPQSKTVVRNKYKEKYERCDDC